MRINKGLALSMGLLASMSLGITKKPEGVFRDNSQMVNPDTFTPRCLARKGWVMEMSLISYNMLDNHPFYSLKSYPPAVWGKEDGASIDKMSGISISLWYKMIEKLSIGGSWGKEWGEVSTDWETPYFRYRVEVCFYCVNIKFLSGKLFRERLRVFAEFQPGVFNGRLYVPISTSDLIIKDYNNAFGMRGSFGLNIGMFGYLSISIKTGLQYLTLYYTIPDWLGSRFKVCAFKPWSFYMGVGLGVSL